MDFHMEQQMGYSDRGLKETGGNRTPAQVAKDVAAARRRADRWAAISLAAVIAAVIAVAVLHRVQQPLDCDQVTRDQQRMRFEGSTPPRIAQLQADAMRCAR